MIIGGVNAAGTAGNIRAGFSESFLPCRAFILPIAVREAMEQTVSRPVSYRVFVEIRDLADVAWVGLGAASYCQVTRNENGSLDSADITIQQPEIWSAYRLGGPHEDLLKPSNRTVRIWAGILAGGEDFTIPLFCGLIKNYSETVGPNGGAISLTLQDHRDLAGRAPSVPVGPERATAFRATLHNFMTLKGAYNAIGMSWGTLTFKYKDFVFETRVDIGEVASGRVMDAILSTIPGLPLLQIKGAGVLSVGEESDDDIQDSAFAYSDRNILVCARAAGSEQYNTARTYGKVGGIPQASEVSDAADVAKRGRLVWPPGFVGSPAHELSDANEIALEMIQVFLKGKFSLEVPFNPYLRPGMQIGLSSSKAALEDSLGKVRQVRHQVSANRSRTYLESVTVKPA